MNKKWPIFSIFLIRFPYDLEQGKCTLVQALRLCTGHTAHRENRGITLLFLDHCTRRGWGVSVTPRPLFTPGKTRYPLYRRLGGLQSRSGQVRKISSPPGFDPQTVQPVVRRYTDWATSPHLEQEMSRKTYGRLCVWCNRSSEIRPLL